MGEMSKGMYPVHVSFGVILLTADLWGETFDWNG